MVGLLTGDFTAQDAAKMNVEVSATPANIDWAAHSMYFYTLYTFEPVNTDEANRELGSHRKSGREGVQQHPLDHAR